MGLIVQKFGGTSVATAEKIHTAAQGHCRQTGRPSGGGRRLGHGPHHRRTYRPGQKSLRRPANPPKREMDQLLATGEQVTIALIAMAIHAQGHQAISFTGGQIGLITDDVFSKARIKSINKQRIFEQLDAGKIVIVAGFQGITTEGDVTTLGRGGSNATLVAIGAVLKADVCENYTDVDGIFTADPRIVKDARKIDCICYDEMMELSSVGASVLQTRAVEFAKKYNVPFHVRNSQNETPAPGLSRRPNMEHIVVSGAALKKDLTRVTFKNVPDHPGVVAKIFGAIAEANIVVDDIIQNVMDDGTANISFTVEHGDVADIKPVVERLSKNSAEKPSGHLSRTPRQSQRRRRRHEAIHTGVAQKCSRPWPKTRSTSRTSPPAKSKSVASSPNPTPKKPSSCPRRLRTVERDNAPTHPPRSVLAA